MSQLGAPFFCQNALLLSPLLNPYVTAMSLSDVNFISYMKPRVLIVDDEPDVLELVDFKLSSEGFEVMKAANGLEGLHKARCENPDVILLDMMLPDLDGISVCEILRAQPSTRDVPVVVFSALDRPLTRARGSRISISHWLKKGSDFGSLSECVRAALEEHRERVKRRLDSEDSQTRELAG
jgi:DNA-binding response OmpR family regulator